MAGTYKQIRGNLWQDLLSGRFVSYADVQKLERQSYGGFLTAAGTRPRYRLAVMRIADKEGISTQEARERFATFLSKQKTYDVDEEQLRQRELYGKGV